MSKKSKAVKKAASAPAAPVASAPAAAPVEAATPPPPEAAPVSNAGEGPIDEQDEDLGDLEEEDLDDNGGDPPLPGEEDQEDEDSEELEEVTDPAAVAAQDVPPPAEAPKPPSRKEVLAAGYTPEAADRIVAEKAEKHRLGLPPYADRFAGAKRIWVAAKQFLTLGVQRHPGDILEGIEAAPGFLGMKNQRFVEARVQLQDGTVVPCPQMAKRVMHHRGRTFHPGDVVPGIRDWQNFRMLAVNGWVEPVSQDRLVKALHAEAAGMGPQVTAAKPSQE